MAIPTPDPNQRSWQEITAHARAERPPAIDVRAAVRHALANEVLEPVAPDWSVAVFELLRLPWVRVAFAASCAVAVTLCFLGWQTLSEEVYDPIRLATQTGAPGAPVFESP